MVALSVQHRIRDSQKGRPQGGVLPSLVVGRLHRRLLHTESLVMGRHGDSVPGTRLVPMLFESMVGGNVPRCP